MNQRKQQAQISRRRMVVGTIFLLGFVPFAKALLESFQNYDFWWLALLTVVTSLFGIRLPIRQKSGAVTITVSDCFIFLGLFLYGLDAAILIGVLDAVTVCLKICPKSVEKLLFNIGQMSLSVFLAGGAFWQTQNSGYPLEIELSSLPLVTLQILASGVLYFALSSFLISLVVASCGELPMRRFFQEYLFKLSPTPILSVMAALAALLPMPAATANLLAVALMGASFLWTQRKAARIPMS